MTTRYTWWLAVLLGLPLAVHAAAFDFTAGRSITSSHHETNVVFASAFGDRPLDDHVHVEPIATVGWVAGRNTKVDHLDRDVYLAGGGVRIIAANHHWFVGEQLATTSTRTDALSSRLEFMTSVGWQAGHFIALLRHISNGHVLGGGHNLGETMLLVGARF